jgi:hypothetical protein
MDRMESVYRAGAPRNLSALRSQRQYSVDFTEPLPTYTSANVHELRRATFALLVRKLPRCFVSREMSWDVEANRPEDPSKVVYITAVPDVRPPEHMKEVSPSSLAKHIIIPDSWGSYCVTKAVEEYFLNEAFAELIDTQDLPVSFLLYFHESLSMAPCPANGNRHVARNRDLLLDPMIMFMDGGHYNPRTIEHRITTTKLTTEEQQYIHAHGNDEQKELVELYQDQPLLVDLC